MTPKEECEELLNALLPFAINQLKKHGEFYPFGAVLNNKSEVILTAVDSGDDHPDSTDMIDRLTEAHSEQAKQSEIIASGICWNASVSNENGVKSDAIIISLEHRDDYSVIVGQPYKMGLFKKVNLKSLFAQKGKHDIFS